MPRDYFLKGQFEQTAPRWISDKALLRKATNELSGICRFMLADGTVSADEAGRLKFWVDSRPELRRDIVVSSFLDRISRIYADGLVTPEECLELAEIIRAFIGEDRNSTTLPLNNPMPPVVFAVKGFCFTGKCASGPRQWCEAQVIQRQGWVRPSVTPGLDFLVVGEIGSEAWANTSYGTKIEKAVELRAHSGRVAIISEEHWLKYLGGA